MTPLRSAGAHAWSVAVVVPARNEEDTLPSCLHALTHSLAACPAVARSWIVVAADSCSDHTVSFARKLLLGRGAVVECSAASVGVARRLGTAQALDHFAEIPASQIWIANTDADTCVSPNWIGRQLELASSGYCGVAGIVEVQSIEGEDSATVRALLADYVLNADGTHTHVHGANLGVRADAYLDAGCWSELALAEDHCLWSRLKARGWPTASCTQTIVQTSGRLKGRARRGFADHLRAKLEAIRGGPLPCSS
jgi:cellulose synthase/poly-beta-1,6-N-acetylglucosamine synthase-like glycosyltransferase